MLYRIKSNSPWRSGLVGTIQTISFSKCVMFYPLNGIPYRIIIPKDCIEEI